MVDRSIKYPRGIIEDILVKVDKFIFPADFVVLDMEEDTNIPIILGRPFLATGGALIYVQKGELKLRVQDEEVVFNVFKTMKYPKESDDIFRVDFCEAVIDDYSCRSDEPLEVCLLNSCDSANEIVTCAALEYANYMDGFEPNRWKYFEELGESPKPRKPSIEEPPEIELKELPSHLRYAFLGAEKTLPVIISDHLTGEQEDKLLRVLRSHVPAIGWTLSDIKGISPSFCTHRILMEDNARPSIEHQRRLNPAMKEVVRKEILKWLDAGVIYPISDSS